MTRQLVIMDVAAGAAGAAGLALLLRPSLARRLFAMPEGEPARYLLRITGAMLSALALFLAGFSTVYYLSL